MLSTWCLGSTVVLSRAVLSAEEWTREEFWGWSILSAVVGFLLCRRWAWATLFILPLALLVPLLAILQRQDPVAHEARWALVLTVAACLAGANRGGIKIWPIGYIMAANLKKRGDGDRDERRSAS